MRQLQPAIHQSQVDGQGAEFLRLPSVIRRTGLGRSTIYRLIAERQFPSPVKLAGRAVGWRRTDLDQWSAARPSTA
jgi:prophage regulatory protein